jgi:hypothetical protein
MGFARSFRPMYADANMGTRPEGGARLLPFNPYTEPGGSSFLVAAHRAWPFMAPCLVVFSSGG